MPKNKKPSPDGVKGEKNKVFSIISFLKRK